VHEERQIACYLDKSSKITNGKLACYFVKASSMQMTKLEQLNLEAMRSVALCEQWSKLAYYSDRTRYIQRAELIMQLNSRINALNLFMAWHNKVACYVGKASYNTNCLAY
jgi:hypothetical protein